MPPRLRVTSHSDPDHCASLNSLAHREYWFSLLFLHLCLFYLWSYRFIQRFRRECRSSLPVLESLSPDPDPSLSYYSFLRDFQGSNSDFTICYALGINDEGEITLWCFIGDTDASLFLSSTPSRNSKTAWVTCIRLLWSSSADYSFLDASSLADGSPLSFHW